MDTKRRCLNNSLLIQLPKRFISLTEAERLFVKEAKALKLDILKDKNIDSSSVDGYSAFMPGSSLSQKLSESDLKKAYLQFARVYHPDVQGTGDKTKF